MLTELHRKCCINKYTDYYIQYIDKDASEVLQSNTCPLLVQNFTQFDFYISPTFIVWKIYKETVCHFKSDDFFSLCALSPWSSERICKIVYLFSLSHKAYPHQTSKFCSRFYENYFDVHYLFDILKIYWQINIFISFRVQADKLIDRQRAIHYSPLVEDLIQFG